MNIQVIIIIYFENINFFHAQLGLDVSPDNKASPHIPEHCPFRLQTEQFHVNIYTSTIWWIINTEKNDSYQL